MLPVRIAWDPSLPVVASQAFTAGGHAFVDGDSFPWRDIDVSELDAVTMWRAGLIHCVPAAVQAAESTQETSAPHLTRAERRAARRQS